MAAVYPSGVKSFQNKTDFTDIILAEHINAIQDEVTAVEAAIGVSPNVSGGYVGTFDDQTVTFSTLSARIANIEKGIKGDVHNQYLKFTGGTLQPANSGSIPLTLQGFTSQAADLLQIKNVGGTVLTKIDKDGKVIVNNQELKPILMQATQPDAVALALPTGTVWVDSDSNPPVLSAETTLQITGGTLQGDQALTSRLRNITVSTADPTGGNNGDIWIKYIA
jgi:hypothetical protein